MSSEDLSSEMNFGDDDDDSNSMLFLGEEEEEEEKEKEEEEDEREQLRDAKYDDDDFESITGFGSKVINRPMSRDRDTLTGQVSSGSGSKSLDQVIQSEEEEEKIKEPFSNCIVENGPHGLGIMDALQISVVLEEMCDQLDIIGMSIDAPQVDIRTKTSIDEDVTLHRPKFTIPATLDPYSNSLFKEKYILRQNYSTVAARRIEQMCNNKGNVCLRRRLTTILNDFGVHRYNMKGKIQAERTHANMILDNVATELIQDFTFHSLVSAIETEKGKYEGMKEKVEKSMQDRQYIIESKETLKKLHVEKKEAKKELQNTLWEFEGNRQELLKRKELEFLYVNRNGLMTKERMKKKCAKSEKVMTDVYNDQMLKKDHYEYVHFLMLDIIYKKYKDAQRRLEYWVEKYETDKENLQAELDQMKADRARDLKRIEWLKVMIKDYEQIVLDDRRIKKIAADREKLDATKNKKATKIQAWWRGEMYRKKLGPYNPKYKGGKGKKGKKGEKGKKK